MNNWQIAILVFSIILLLVTVVNIVFDFFFVGWVLIISWVNNILCLTTGIMSICALCRHLGIKFYKTCLIFLYICDFLSLLLFILFFISGYFNFTKILYIATLTPFEIILQMFVNRFSVLNLPLVNTPQQPYQPGIYQQGYDPNINQVNYQPGYIPTVKPNYQPPQYQNGNISNAPPSYEQQVQYKPGNEPTVNQINYQEQGNQPGFEPIAPQSNEQSLIQPGNESNRPTTS